MYYSASRMICVIQLAMLVGCQGNASTFVHDYFQEQGAESGELELCVS
jgi:hypothetical protein